MRRHDRLALLGACHGHLRYHGLGSLDAFRAASPEQLSHLNPKYRAMIRRLVDEGDCDVLRALWPPRDVTWLVARLATDPYARLLSVSKGPHAGSSRSVLDLTYDVRDAVAERQVWRALRDVLRSG